ncbi:ribonuclease HI [Chitinophaga terrae (ex Kim and Jung 2007)]|uniref:ribonuclease H1 domain-containing protein n=1 Tax=Chitinophaga terrae (ex Kim and Jung 2007) TaxID=408074 RepID=UPI002788A9A1|nr:ribonuclease H family protein [Chitinophaga terrae (ex Kim and Jung 2007)]MDQ0107135.1 ribonuclease HI [Chitinophaga terrae (ex Kim and Jung 2007)]
MSKQKFYVVWKGRQTGIFNNWEECKAQIDGFPGAVYKSFPTLNLAREAFAAGPSVNHENGNNSTTPTSSFIRESIAVDAAWNTVTKDMEFQAIDNQTNEVIFRRGPYKNATGNIGEYLAIILALEYCRKNNLPQLPIYSDSLTAIKWVKDKEPNTSLPATEENKPILLLLQKATDMLKENEYPNPILKWETKEWGENPADFGRK